MNHDRQLRTKIIDLLEKWQKTGLPSRSKLEAEAEDMLIWKDDMGLTGLWDKPPLMLTATLDDGLGQGLELIHLYSKVAGLRIIFLGLLQSAENIIAASQKHIPDLLGITVLQFSSEESLKQITGRLPAKTRVIAGGPLFRADPDFAGRTDIHYAAKDVAAFMRFLLNLSFKSDNLYAL